MKFKQALNEASLNEVKVTVLAQAIKNKNPNIYTNLGASIVDDANKPLVFQEVSDALLKQGVDITKDFKLRDNIRTSTAQEERNRADKAQMAQNATLRKGYAAGQQRLQAYRNTLVK